MDLAGLPRLPHAALTLAVSSLVLSAWPAQATPPESLASPAVVAAEDGAEDSVEPDNSSPAATDAGDTAEPAAEAPAEAGESADDGWPGSISAEIGLVSDYIDRGISNTDHHPAIQGGLTYSLATGIGDTAVYAGFWGSNVDFDDGGEAKLEIDWIFGLNGTIPGSDLAWDIGGAYYIYPGANHRLNYDYWEIPVILSYPILEGVELSGSYYYSPDYSGNTGQAHYLNAAVNWEFPVNPVSIVLSASTGHQWISDNELAGIPDYQDWKIGVTVNIDKISVGIDYTDTNLGKDECFQGTSICDPTVVFRIGANF